MRVPMQLSSSSKMLSTPKCQKRRALSGETLFAFLLLREQYIACKHTTITLLTHTHTHIIYRAETLFSGLVIRPDTEDPSNSSHLSILTQTDVKGLIPKLVINKALAKFPDHWRQLLISFYHDVYSKKAS